MKKKFGIRRRPKLFFGLLFLALFIGSMFLSLVFKERQSFKVNKSVPDYAGSFFEECSSGRLEKTICYSRLLYNLSLEKGLDYSLKVLSSLQERDSEALRCHFMAHAIGEGTYLRDKETWQQTLSNAPTICSYGISHGILESFFEEKNVDNLVDENVLSSICTGEKPSCHHSVGHIIMLETGGKVEESISACKIYPEGDGRNYCYNGVFMEYISPRILIEHGVLKDSQQKSDDRLSELTNFCNAFSDDAVAAQCWGELSLPAIEAFQNDANSVFSFCAQAPGDTAVEQCDSRVIANFVISHKFDLVEAKKICSFFIQPEEMEECYMQIVAVALGQLSDVAKVKDFCISLPAPSRTRCLERIVKVQN